MEGCCQSEGQPICVMKLLSSSGRLISARRGLLSARRAANLCYEAAKWQWEADASLKGNRPEQMIGC
jgi:hypothetical protein